MQLLPDNLTLWTFDMQKMELMKSKKLPNLRMDNNEEMSEWTSFFVSMKVGPKLGMDVMLVFGWHIIVILGNIVTSFEPNHDHELATTEIETIDDGDEENDVVTPVIYEEDSDESGDGESEDSMDIESIKDGKEPVVYSDISDDEVYGGISDY